MSFSGGDYSDAKRLAEGEKLDSLTVARGVDFWLGHADIKTKVKNKYLVYFEDNEKSVNDRFYNLYIDSNNHVHVIDLCFKISDVDLSEAEVFSELDNERNYLKTLGNSRVISGVSSAPLMSVYGKRGGVITLGGDYKGGSKIKLTEDSDVKWEWNLF